MTPTTSRLETPDVEEEVVEARGDDLEEYLWRPPFTGDIFDLPKGAGDSPLTIALIQHPCAMRSGVELRPTLLACVVNKRITKPRTDWHNRPYTEFAIQEPEGSSWRILDFDQLLVVSREAIADARRTLVLSEVGVNLLVQRWIHYNSRVIIPTITINEQLSPQFAEADLVMEVAQELTQSGWGDDDVRGVVEGWLSSSSVNTERSRRARLADPQQRSAVRREIRSLLAALPEAPATD